MNKLIIGFLACMLSLSCEKSSTSQKASVGEDICFEGKFLNTIACNDTSAVQILSPVVGDSLNLAYKGPDGKNYTAAVAADIPENFRDGEVFYFTVDSIYHTESYLMNCLYVPTYSVSIKTISRAPCSAKTD
jgi:hypothetical protein